MEEPVNHATELEGLSEELDGFFCELRNRQENSAVRIVRLERESAQNREFSEELLKKSVLREQELSASVRTAQRSLIEARSELESVCAERDELRRMLDEASRQLAQEKERAVQKEDLIRTSASSAKEREAEAARVWKTLEELKAELAASRVEVKEKENEVKKAAASAGELELDLKKAQAENINIQEGFSAKIIILKKELCARERELAAFGARNREYEASAALRAENEKDQKQP